MLDVWQQLLRHNGRDGHFQILQGGRSLVGSQTTFKVQFNPRRFAYYPFDTTRSQVGWSRQGMVNSVLLSGGRADGAQCTPSKLVHLGHGRDAVPGVLTLYDASNKPLARVEMQHDVGQWGVVLS